MLRPAPVAGTATWSSPEATAPPLATLAGHRREGHGQATVLAATPEASARERRHHSREVGLVAGPPPRRWPSRLFLPHLLQQQSPPVAPVGRGHPRRYLPLSRPGELRPRLPPHLLQTLPRQAVWSRRWASEAPSRGTWMASVAGTRTVTAGARRATGRHQTAKASSPRPLPCRLPTGRRYQCRLRHGHFRTHRYRVLWRRGSRRPSGQPQAAMAVQWGTARLGRQRARQKAGDSR